MESSTGQEPVSTRKRNSINTYPVYYTTCLEEQSYVYIMTNQSINKEKQKQLTETEHQHTPTPKTNTQQNLKPMTKTKIHDPQFEKLQQNQTKNKQENNHQSQITKKILKKTFNKQTSPLEKQKQMQQNQSTKLTIQRQLWATATSHNCQNKQKKKTINKNRKQQTTKKPK